MSRSKRLGKRWRIVQGTSRAIVRAPDFNAAMARASAIGFHDPDSVLLVDEGASVHG